MTAEETIGIDDWLAETRADLVPSWSAQPGLYSVPKSFSDVSATAWQSASERPPRICAASECR